MNLLRASSARRLRFTVHWGVVVEIKAVENILPVHQAQLLTYLKAGKWTTGLLINFNVPILKQGIHRRVLNLQEENNP